MTAAPPTTHGPRRGRLASWDVHGPLPHLLLGLTVLTGIVDAVSYIALGHVFVANMTGNVVLLGFALAGAPSLSIPASLTAIGLFLVGAALGGVLARRFGDHRGVLLRTSTAFVAAVLVVALVVALVAGDPVADGPRYVLIAVLAVPMGAQAAVARRIGVPDLTTAVLTMTLTGLAADSRLLGGPGGFGGPQGSGLRRVAAVAAMGAGALAGGLLVVHVAPAAALALALAVGVAVAVTAHRVATRPGASWATKG
ncbi:YoaK family protein [Patulibacter minatonensis]|uniref:YoaK family protein n=1 Tax=Patulibacter minatonensis TaxID=298163 RepID=UPI0004B63E89|nr:YoaK family protein [Patulibacter minatonensis]